jgi:hypothetical protein
MYKVHRIGEHWIILYHEDDDARPVDGGKVYPHRQAAYRRCKRLNEALEVINAMIAKDGAIIV